MKFAEQSTLMLPPSLILKFPFKSDDSFCGFLKCYGLYMTFRILILTLNWKSILIKNGTEVKKCLEEINLPVSIQACEKFKFYDEE